jgi:hypothetical protein
MKKLIVTVHDSVNVPNNNNKNKKITHNCKIPNVRKKKSAHKYDSLTQHGFWSKAKLTPKHNLE